ncbi:MAG: Sjogren's syndrome/scleroderma autoantigen 1 family protein [Candidatus Hodarchaeaceae archaeon]|nr:Sjogren's syndrome/scleroderma autoantigen 1 family protein [Candidatus Hodarchaeaceae archaeon]
MAEMLLAGGKMLSLHCATCKSPLFEYKGKVVCPICGEKTKATTPEKAELRAMPAIGEIEGILLEKLNQLAAELKREGDRRTLAELLGLMKSILEVLEKLKAR